MVNESLFAPWKTHTEFTQLVCFSWLNAFYSYLPSISLDASDHDGDIISIARNLALIRIPETQRLIVHRPGVPRMDILVMLQLACSICAGLYHLNHWRPDDHLQRTRYLNLLVCTLALVDQWPSTVRSLFPSIWSTRSASNISRWSKQGDSWSLTMLTFWSPREAFLYDGIAVWMVFLVGCFVFANIHQAFLAR